jgi:hypothetical protein
VDGKWKLTSAASREESNQQSGDTFKFEEEAQKRLLFGSLEQGRHGERHGSLKLSSGGKLIFSGEGKLLQSDFDPRRKKQGKSKASRSLFTFVPASRLDAGEFKAMRGHIGVTLDAEFVVKAESSEPENGAGNGVPAADDENVVPGSNADHMKANARRKLAGAAA